jgi:hypothetical protein
MNNIEYLFEKLRITLNTLKNQFSFLIINIYQLEYFLNVNNKYKHSVQNLLKKINNEYIPFK